MITDFSNDVVANLKNMIIDIASYKNFGKEELLEVIDKLFILNQIKQDKNKFIIINICDTVDLPIKKQPVTKCFLTSTDGEVISENLEVNIFSLDEARKAPDNSSDLVKVLKRMADSKFLEDTTRYTDLKKWLRDFTESDDFQEIEIRINNNIREKEN